MKHLIFFALIYCSSVALNAQIKLPSLFSDHMVIQRDKPIKIWGQAGKGENVTVTFNETKVSVKADKSGNWQVVFPAFGASGPCQLEVKGKNTITLNDVMIGDVWFCSGQSNMEFSVRKANNAEVELKDTNYPNIRLFSVPNGKSETPQNDIREKRSWMVSSSETVRDFSAVGYFFGKNLNKEQNVPIGLINSSVGGTAIQDWMNMESVGEFPAYQSAVKEMKTINYEALQKESQRREGEWRDTIFHLEPGTINKWFLPETKTNDWTPITVPWEWSKIGLNGNGVGWFRKEFELTEEEAASNALIFLSIIFNDDETWLNGVKIGECSEYYQKRIYFATPPLLRKGKNVLVVKVYNYWFTGGFIGKADEMYIQIKAAKKSLAGDWLFKKGYIAPNPGLTVTKTYYPSLLYNSMVNPVTKFPIKGVIWYQGEANQGEAAEYRSLLPSMINGWRKKWDIGDFPFLIVQLANYIESDATDSNWAFLREAQASALSLPNTGLAVTIDIGEGEDIHPKNKQDVGFRLALAAQKVAYGQNVVFSGPTFKSIKIEGNTAIIDFDNQGSGLISNDKYGFLKGFVIAGADHKFYWAKASIEGNKVVVSSSHVAAPVAVRYAWGNNPDASLYNAEKLPAIPFRTDN